MKRIKYIIQEVKYSPYLQMVLSYSALMIVFILIVAVRLILISK